MEREFGKIGRFVFEKQCDDLGIDPEEVKSEDIPELSKTLSEVITKFDDGRAKRVLKEIKDLLNKESVVEVEKEEEESTETSREEPKGKAGDGLTIKEITEKLVSKKTEVET